MRAVLSVIAGFLMWWVAASLISRGLKLAWPEYGAAETLMHFTVGMLWARLAMGALATLAAGWTTSRVAQGRRGAALAIGVVLLVFFVPVHIKLLAAFPLWYHIAFLGSLLPLALLPWYLTRAESGTDT